MGEEFTMSTLFPCQLSILEDGEVCIEFLSPDRTVGRVLRVSGDGCRVLLYRPPLSGAPIDGPPPPTPPGCRPRPWDALPRPYWAKYACAARFVSLVRQKTPKIIFYAEAALCILLGSGDFEVSFYSGGWYRGYWWPIYTPFHYFRCTEEHSPEMYHVFLPDGSIVVDVSAALNG